mgnify:CR=1 FL=1
MISDPKFNTAKEWFEKLRDNLVETIQNIDEKKFEISNSVSYTHLTLPTSRSV